MIEQKNINFLNETESNDENNDDYGNSNKFELMWEKIELNYKKVCYNCYYGSANAVNKTVQNIYFIRIMRSCLAISKVQL